MICNSKAKAAVRYVNYYEWRRMTQRSKRSMPIFG